MKASEGQQIRRTLPCTLPHLANSLYHQAKKLAAKTPLLDLLDLLDFSSVDSNVDNSRSRQTRRDAAKKRVASPVKKLLSRLSTS
jgi:hypothetical protein